jgi:hypothetical protein
MVDRVVVVDWKKEKGTAKRGKGDSVLFPSFLTIIPAAPFPFQVLPSTRR